MNNPDRTAYSRRLTIEGIVLFLLALVLVNQHANAQACYNVERNGGAVFSAPTLQINGSTWNFTGDCGQPPPPVNDPNALNNIVGQFAQHQCARYSTSTGQDFSQLWGRSDAAGQPITTTWPYLPSTTLMVPLPPNGRYYGGVITSGPNPGTLPHYLKINGYAGSCVPPLQTPPSARFNVRVVAVGTTAPPVGRCSITNAPPDNTPLVQFKFAGPINSAHCLGVIGGVYRYIVENAGAGNVTTLLTWN